MSSGNATVFEVHVSVDVCSGSASTDDKLFFSTGCIMFFIIIIAEFSLEEDFEKVANATYSVNLEQVVYL